MRVLDFNRDNLARALTNTPDEEDNQKDKSIHHLDFFVKYLENLHAEFIVIETEYTDSDYLDDFAFFYVTCNHKYGSICRRVHFFSSLSGIAEEKKCESFRNFVLKSDNKSVKNLNKSYLGFIVVRPLPEVIIGRTILKPLDINDMIYTCRRKYIVNFYGISLEIYSLAFQEQDEAIAACATVALWSAFHKTSELFLTSLPKASEITKSATDYYNDQRSFPATGLSIQQMRNAIVQTGLESQIYQHKQIYERKTDYLLSIIYAYLKMGIPIILDVTLMTKVTDCDYEHKGEHAITIVGYKCQESVNNFPTSVKIKSSKVSSISVHDDQFGPFSCLDVLYKNDHENFFNNLKSSLNCEATLKGFKKTDSIRNVVLSYDDSQSRIAIPNGLIIPIYDKIRVPYHRIFEYCANFDDILKKMYVNLLKYTEPENEKFHEQDDDAKLRYASELLEWDIHLITTNALKIEIRDKFISDSSMKDSDDSIRDNFERLMLKSHPKYIWRAKLTLTLSTDFKQDILDIYADASDTPHAFPVYEMIWYSSSVRMLYKTLIEQSPSYLLEKEHTEEYLFLKKYLT